MLRELQRRDAHFTGCLYAGLMLTADGPRVLEFNVRFGDPETQVVVPRLAGDLVEALLACASGRLEPRLLATGPGACVTVVLAAAGYPAAPRLGDPISGLEEAGAMEGVTVYHAGTALRDGRVVTAGGRVLAVSGRGSTIAAARERAYLGAAAIAFDGRQLRSDIALDAEDREAGRVRV